MLSISHIFNICRCWQNFQPWKQNRKKYLSKSSKKYLYPQNCLLLLQKSSTFKILNRSNSSAMANPLLYRSISALITILSTKCSALSSNASVLLNTGWKATLPTFSQILASWTKKLLTEYSISPKTLSSLNMFRAVEQSAASSLITSKLSDTRKWRKSSSFSSKWKKKTYSASKL